MLLRRIWLTVTLSALFAALAVLAARVSVAVAAEPHALAASHFTAPAHGPITVEFVVSDMTDVLDVAGAWEVFEDTTVPSRGPGSAFRLLIVAQSKAPVRMGMDPGLNVLPTYTFDDAPKADLIVVPAQEGRDKLTTFLLARHADGEAIMSICTGAFQLAATGLLDGKPATTHHDYMSGFSKQFPRVTLMPGNRYIQSDAKIFTAGGLTSGIDLALHIVALYFGDAVATRTANYLEYTGMGWKAPQGASPVAD
jgi:transcriptional regulator GlxA family with amidase domain